MNERLFVVLPAAGRALRFGGTQPKQYLPLAGRSVLEWSLLAMQALAPSAIVLAVAQDDLHWQRIAAAAPGLFIGVQTVVGGDDRATSVGNALHALAQQAAEDDWVMVHDVARPCVRVDDCQRLRAAVREHPCGGLLAIPVPDTVKRAHADRDAALQSVSRERLWLAQTPQLFRYGLLRAALRAAVAAAVAVTDEASALEHIGQSPLLLRGDADNFKLTWPDDLARAAAVLGRRARAARGVPA